MQPGLKSVAADIRGLEAAIVTVIPDNLLYDAWSRNNRIQDADEAATYFGDLVRIHFGALQSIDVERGDIQLTIESGDAIILVRNIRGNYVITLVFQDNVPLGLMRVHTEKLISHVAATLPSFDDDGALPFEPKDTPSPAGFTEFTPDAPTPFGDAADANDPHTSAPSDATPADAQAEGASDDATPEEAPTYYGYVYARDRDRLEAERAAAEAKRRAQLAEGGHYAEEDEARAQQDAALTAPVEALRMDAEGGTFPAESLHTNTTPSTTEQERQLLLAEQEHGMANEGGIPLPLSKPAIQEVRDVTGRHDIQVLPRHVEPDEAGDATSHEAASIEAKREERRLMLAEQEHRMTSEGGVPLPLSEAAIKEARQVTGRHDIEVLDIDREALAAARRRSPIAGTQNAPTSSEATRNDGPQDLNFDRSPLTPLNTTPDELDIVTDADTFAPGPLTAAEAPSEAPSAREPSSPRSRAEAIILYVTANTATPQNVGARLAVHSRISLDEIKTPDELDAEQTERLEEAAKAILGVSELPI